MAACPGSLQHNKNLKDALYSCIRGILDPTTTVRNMAEKEMQALEVTEEFGVHLTEIALNKNEELPIRQLAAVLLKQYIETHWCSGTDKFEPPEVTDSAKLAIKNLLPHGLHDPNSKMRSSVGHAVSSIAQWDWPENWSELFDILVRCLGGTDHSVHGAMKVLSEFSKDLTETQVPTIAPVILSETFRIFEAENVYSVTTRAQAIEIFITITDLIFFEMTNQQSTNTFCKTILLPVLPRFIERFVINLSLNGATTDDALKSEIVKAISHLLNKIPKKMHTYLPQILPPIWTLLKISTEKYQKITIDETGVAEPLFNLDGQAFEYGTLVYALLEFVHLLVESQHPSTKDFVPLLLPILTILMKITKDQEQNWLDNPDEFVEQEHEDGFGYSIRFAAHDIFLLLFQDYEDVAFQALAPTLSHHFQTAAILKDSGDPNWWKIHESCMLAIGSIKENLFEKNNLAKTGFNIQEYMSNAMVHLQEPSTTFLTGRCLWLGAQFANIITPSMLEHFLQAVGANMNPSKHAILRISAARSICSYCNNLKDSNHLAVLVRHMPNFLDNLVEMCQNFSAKVMGLALQALCIMMSIDHPFTASVEHKVIPMSVTMFIKYNTDPIILDLVQEMVRVLSLNPHCRESLLTKLVPQLVSVLNTPSDKLQVGIQTVALDMLQTLVRNSTPPLSEALIQNAFPAAVQCILRTDDQSTMHSGGECLRAFISVAPEQICSYRNGEGLGYILQVSSQLLDPNAPEYAASFVGRLIITLITKAGSQLGENVDILLKSVLSKMQCAKTLAVIMSLVITFAHLFLTQMEAVMNFLTTIPGPTGEPAIVFVFTEWLNRQHLFYGTYERKVSTLALCKIFEYIIATNDIRLTCIKIKGDPVGNPKGIQTRSKQTMQCVEIPVVFKIYKLLLNELENLMESNSASSKIPTVTDDDSTDDSDLENDVSLGGRGILLSEIDLDDEDSEEDDPDFMFDPICQVNLQEHLKDYLQRFSQNPVFPAFIDYLSEPEKVVLRLIGVNV